MAIVGFMGAGKSAVGSRLARRLAVPFIDTDARLVAEHGAIQEIFARSGEAYFRRLEHDAVLAALAEAFREPRVVSLGGGAVTDGDVREALQRLAHVAWLDAPVATLYARARGGQRPLARDEARFQELYDERRPLYESVATVRVVNDGTRTLAQIVDELQAALEAEA